jgi:Fe-S cluster assembly iron-binding protein IscA
MLTMTENASSVVRTIVEGTPSTDTGGLRIVTDQPGGTAFSVDVAMAPEPTDSIVEQGGARVFVENIALEALDNQILDAEVATDGSVRFALAVQTAVG